MGDFPVVHESSQPIYNTAKLCSERFDNHLQATDGTTKEYLAREELCWRFKQWAAYVGAFAVPKASLDVRLAPHEDIRDRVLELLYMIYANLEWINVGDTAEENSDTSPGLPAIEGAIDRLLILSVNIRRSARQTNRLRQGNGNAQDESLCRLLVQRRYPHARKSLCSQLSASICARGRSLQYLQEHNKKLAYQRENQEDAKELVNNEGKPEEELDAQAVPIGDVASRKRKASQGPETLPSMVSSSAIVRLNRTRRIPTSTIISKGSTVQDSQGNDYDYPPWPKEKHGKRYQSCTICAMPLDVLTLTKRAWETHVDQDLEPYVCISEDCIEPPQYFTSLRDWMDHMQMRHSMNWSEKIHTDRWYCDVGHPKLLEFDEKTAFFNHLKSDHGTKLTRSQLQGRLRRNRWIATRDPYVCPLCDYVPRDTERRIGEIPNQFLWEHVAEHLKSLAFFSLSYLTNDGEDGASIPDSSKVSDKDDLRISRDSLSNWDLENFDDVPSTRIYSKSTQNDDFAEEESLEESVNWDFLPDKSFSTDYEYLKKHLKWSQDSLALDIDSCAEESFSVSFSLLEVPETEHFVARQEELNQIHKALDGDSRPGIVVLYGLGGIGKTQLAVTYAKRHKANYSAIFWLNSNDEDSLKQSFGRAARHILKQYPSTYWLSMLSEENSLDEMVDAVKRWLNHPKNTQWLIVYDNYDSRKLRDNTVPTAADRQRLLFGVDHGSIIITTRSSQVEFGYRIKVGKLRYSRDSLDILSFTSRRGSIENNLDAVKLAEKLDGHPLALVTAGTYLDQVATSFADFLRMYEESWLKLLKMSPGLITYEDHALYSTWQLSFDHIKQQNELSTKLLKLWAYFDNQDLWFELLRHGISDGPEWLSQLTQDELAFNQAMRLLCEYGLVGADDPLKEGENESSGYSMDSYIHSWTINVLNQEWEAEMAKTALKCVGLHVPDHKQHKYWVTQNRLIRHAARCGDMVVRGLMEVDGMEWSLCSLGNLYSDRGKLREAEEMYWRALDGYEKALGLDHPSTLNAVNSLGILYADKGKLVEAEEMYRRALDGYKKVLSPDHPSTLDTVNNLGNLYKDQGKPVEAEEMYRRALDGYEKVLGPDHPSTLNAVNSLGILYADKGKPVEAEEMYRRALDGYEKVLGPDHASTLNAVNSLGNLYKDQGKLVEAEEMYQRALDGSYHPSTFRTTDNLRLLKASQGGHIEVVETIVGAR